MKQQWNVATHDTKVWDRWSNPYPSSAPTVHSFTDAYSNDLIFSVGNRKRYGGGPFHVVKRTLTESNSLGGSALIRGGGANNKHAQDGILRAKFARVTNSSFPAAPTPNDAQLMSLGRRAISLVAPTQSEFDAAQALGEVISEGLPGMIGLASRKRDIAGRSADEYLNYTFGVKPLMNDIRSAVNAYRNSERIWNDYVRRSGKRTQRDYNFSVEHATSVSKDVGPVQCIVAAYVTGVPTLVPLTKTTTTTVKRWFSGDFRYYVPQASPFERNASRWEKLYGVIPDIDTLWELTPWSWAADWVSDIGVFASNVSLFSKDSLAMENAFMMEHQTITHEYHLQGVTFRSIPGYHDFVQTLKTECKYRIPATPYGFYADWPDFTNQQLAILGALGISRRAPKGF